MIGADRSEAVMEWLCGQAQVRPFDIKTTAAPQYRRIVMQHRRRARGAQGESGFLFTPDAHRSAKGINDGNGFVFISHTGEVYPSGFLPVSAGNVRAAPLAALYRDTPVFRALRDPSLLKGRCGACEFRGVCGGSRARAYAVTGDYLESDPSCPYVPESLRRERARDDGRAAASGERP